MLNGRFSLSRFVSVLFKHWKKKSMTHESLANKNDDDDDDDDDEDNNNNSDNNYNGDL